MNRSIYFGLFLVVSLLTVTVGCSKKGSSHKNVSDGDSTVIKEQANIGYDIAQLSDRHLPDTAFSSIESITYRVDTFELSIKGDIEDLSDLYVHIPGAFTFRKNGFRNASFDGTLQSSPSEIVIDWTFLTDTDYRETKYGRWGGGSGWTGQPLFVEWPDSCIDMMKSLLRPDFSGKEIIIGSLSSRVYFIDYESGKASRASIEVGNPIKGTVSLDPTLNGNLYVGQGVPAQHPFGALTINLYRGKITDFTDVDPHAWRGWGAYDSSPIRVGQFLFRPGENGTLYKYLILPGRLLLHSTLRYRVNGAAPGMEASMAVYKNYGYTADNHGNILCVNLDNMHPVWLYRLGDDTDATPVIEIEDGHPYIYDGCEIDRQNEGNANFVKLDGLTGQLIWKSSVAGKRFETEDNKHFDGGFYATALPGTKNCSHLIFSNCVINNGGRQNGEFIAFNKSTGQIVYKTPLKYYAWSSPVGMLDEQGNMWIVTADCAGRIYVIDGLSGKIMVDKVIGTNFESTPVVHGNSLVIGSRGNSIYKISIK